MPSRPWKRFAGSGTGGDINADDLYKQLRHGQVTRDGLDIIASGAWQMNVFAGGSKENGLPCSATGDQRVLNVLQLLINNENDQITDFDPDANDDAEVVIRFRYYIRLDDASGLVTITPKLWRGTVVTAVTTAATISGASAATGSAANFSGTGQYQEIIPTVPSGVTLWEAGFTVGGTPNAGAQAFVQVLFDCFVQRP